MKKDVNLPLRETSLGCWGGSSAVWMSFMIKEGVGVPKDEGEYISEACYEKTTESRDTPKVFYKMSLDKTLPFDETNYFLYTSDPKNYSLIKPYTQKFYDDFNLFINGILIGDYGFSSETNKDRYYQKYKFPKSYGYLCDTPYNSGISIDMLKNSKYKIVSYKVANSSQLRNLNWYKQQLADNKEIIFGVEINPNEFKNGVWKPVEPEEGEERTGGHVMLIVGYDDDKNAFIVKNSWGRVSISEDGEIKRKARPVEADEDGDGFIYMDYGWVDDIYEAVVITGVTNPDFYNDNTIAPNNILFGRWLLYEEAELEKSDKPSGVIDLYHIPGIKSYAFIDKRRGTYFKEDGYSYRVNGSFVYSGYYHRNSGFKFYYDPLNPGITPEADDVGKIFTGYLFDEDNALAGFFTDTDGQEYGFLALRVNKIYINGIYNSFKYGNVEHPIVPSIRTFQGKWKIQIDNNIKEVFFGDEEIGTDGDSVVIKGEYQGLKNAGNNSLYRIETKLSNLNSFQMDLKFSNGKEYEFYGRLFKNDPYRMAGYTIINGVRYGFYGEKVSDIPPMFIEIEFPVQKNIYLRNNVRLKANLYNGKFYDSYKIIWVIVDNDYNQTKVGEGLDINVSLPYTDGEEIIAVCAVTLDKDICQNPIADDTKKINVINAPPEVNITQPLDGETFCIGQTILFKADVTDFNEVSIDENRVQWTLSDIGTKTGLQMEARVNTVGSYTATVTYLDDGGMVGEDNININVVECTNYPPDVKITYPDNGSELPSPDNIYDDGTEDITIYVDYTVTDKEDGTVPKDNLTWTLYIPEIDYTFVGIYNETEICVDITPFGCRAYQTIKSVKFEKIPSCKDGELGLSAFDSDGNFGSDKIILKKRTGCNLI